MSQASGTWMPKSLRPFEKQLLNSQEPVFPSKTLGWNSGFFNILNCLNTKASFPQSVFRTTEWVHMGNMWDSVLYQNALERWLRLKVRQWNYYLLKKVCHTAAKPTTLHIPPLVCMTASTFKWANTRKQFVHCTVCHAATLGSQVLQKPEGRLVKSLYNAVIL